MSFCLDGVLVPLPQLLDDPPLLPQPLDALLLPLLPQLLELLVLLLPQLFGPLVLDLLQLFEPQLLSALYLNFSIF
jgi:hypothetical protein